MPPVPRGQSRPFESGCSGLPWIFVTRPFFTCARTPHFQKQSSQNVGMIFSPSVPGSWTTSGSRPHQFEARPVPAAATATPAPPILMNSRRLWAISSPDGQMPVCDSPLQEAGQREIS